MRRLQRARPLHQQAARALLDAIRDMDAKENRLPSEEELTRRLGVSRATVREALQALVAAGVITRRHGKGTYAHPSVLAIRHRVDQNPDFRDLLAEPGRTVCVEPGPFDRTEPTETMRWRMPDLPEGRVWVWEWAYHRDGELCVIARMQIPEGFFVRPPAHTGEETVSSFVARYCGRDLACFASWIGALDEPDIARRFGTPQTVVQRWEEVYRDLRDQAVCYASVFFHPERMEPAILTSLGSSGDV